MQRFGQPAIPGLEALPAERRQVAEAVAPSDDSLAECAGHTERLHHAPPGERVGLEEIGDPRNRPRDPAAIGSHRTEP